MPNQQLKLKATPEKEDFRGKYESGKLGDKLLDNYFAAVNELFRHSSLHEKKSAKAIEIGCGEGLSTKRLVQMLPNHVSLEASEYVDHQIPLAQKNNPGIKVIQESIYELTHNDNKFDLVFLLEVLEHLDYPDKALAELKRVLKPGGYLIVGVPREPIWRGLNMLRGKYLSAAGNTPGHLNHWSSKSLVNYLNNGFGNIKAVKKPLPWTLALCQATE